MFSEKRVSPEKETDSDIFAVWDLTKPSEPFEAQMYREALLYVSSVPDKMSHYRPFYRPKPSGENRLIFYPVREMTIVQVNLTRWIVKNFPLGEDYAYLGLGVKPAAEKHRGARDALVFDLDSAYLHVTSAMIAGEMKKHMPQEKHRLIPAIVDLLTVQDTLQQGLVSSPYVYDLAVVPLDRDLMDLSSAIGVTNYTRYSDNFCVSSTISLDFDETEKAIKKTVEARGFNLSWTKRFHKQPIEYLGTVISPDGLTVSSEKLDEFLAKVDEAIADPAGAGRYHEIMGIYNWAHHICGDNVPEELLNRLYTYFNKPGVGGPPSPLTEMLARRRQDKMF